MSSNVPSISDGLLVYITAGDEEEARRIAKTVVERRLAACANIVSNMTAVFRWQGEVREAQEVIVFLKSRKAVLEQLVAAVREVHSYSVPCVTAFPIEGGHVDYIDWIADEVQST